MSENTDPLTREEFYGFMDRFAGELNKAFQYVNRRFDDIERRLERLESDIHTVKNDTRLIDPMFELIRTDGAEVGELKVRVKKLEGSS